MKNKALILGLLLLIVLALTACGGKEAGPGVGEPGGPTATPDPVTLIPDIIPILDGAYDFEITEATNTYAYRVPMMIQDTVDTLMPQLEAKGWTLMGNPTVMGHLATVNADSDEYRMSISMQDNEHSQSTRIQFLLMKK